MRVLIRVLLTASVAAAPAAVWAQAQQQPQGAAVSGNDPNQIICEKQEVTGSRLAHRKVCMTRSQWNDARRTDRADTEKIQTERGLIAPTPGG